MIVCKALKQMRHVHFAKITGDYKKPRKPIKMAATVSKTGHVAEFVLVPVLLYKYCISL